MTLLLYHMFLFELLVAESYYHFLVRIAVVLQEISLINVVLELSISGLKMSGVKN